MPSTPPTAAAEPVHILYLASFRDRAGRADETVALPETVATVGDLVAWLRARGGREAEALAGATAVRCAVNQRLARESSLLGPGDEIAFFPPMTGG